MGMTVIGGITTFFKNQYPTKCPVTKCQLKTKGCNSTYQGSNLKMDLASPFELKAKRDVIQGYKEQVCIECTNG